MDGKRIGYWLTTGLFAFALFGSGVMDLMLPPEMVEAMTRMGYPLYFVQILGFWKILGVVAILAPAFPRVKEWAYAGFFFDLSGAVASHLISGDGVGGAAPAAVLLAIGAASYALRPADRALSFDPPEPALAR